jgi:hypothetical protein
MSDAGRQGEDIAKEVSRHPASLMKDRYKVVDNKEVLDLAREPPRLPVAESATAGGGRVMIIGRTPG